MKIIFDLDGTLICSKKRLYELFCDLTETRELSFDLYWDLKFLGYTNEDILRNQLKFTANEIELFVSSWMYNIESDEYLKMDTLIDGAENFLRKISESNKLYVCTARQSISQVTEQLTKLGILCFFQEIFVTEQKKTKKQLLLDSDLIFSIDDVFVGDTGHDIMTGKELGMTTFAVLSGFMSKEKLQFYSPDFIVNDITVLDI